MDSSSPREPLIMRATSARKPGGCCRLISSRQANRSRRSWTRPFRDRPGRQPRASACTLPLHKHQGERAMTTASETPKARTVDMKFEIVVIPVSDIDRAKRFYGGLGWRLDADFAAGDDFRVIQFTPPGSACSVIFGKNVTAAAPGSARGLYLIVSDLEAARKDLLERGIDVSKPFHGAGDVHAGPDEPYLSGSIRVSGVDPKRGSYGSFASFSDPDGNGWLFQEITTRLPGRIDAADTTFTS